MFPAWLKVVSVLLVLLVASSYFSADMRAVFAAAWAMCF